jgi:hypothetical protein
MAISIDTDSLSRGDTSPQPSGIDALTCYVKMIRSMIHRVGSSVLLLRFASMPWIDHIDTRVGEVVDIARRERGAPIAAKSLRSAHLPC